MQARQFLLNCKSVLGCCCVLKYRSLTIADYDAVMGIFASCFGVSCYQTSSGEVCQDFKASVEYCLSEGDSRGVVTEDGTLVGFALAFNYDVVSESMLCRLFGCSSYVDIPSGGHIHNAIKNLWFVTYIVSVAVLAAYADAVSLLFSSMRDEFVKGYLVSDTASKDLYDSYMSVGFTGVELGDIYYVSSGTKIDVEFTLKT